MAFPLMVRHSVARFMALAFILALVLALLSVMMPVRAVFAQDTSKVTVFAAASMKELLEAAASEFEKRCACKVVLSLAASGSLARQIENGAPTDLFISANQDWVDWLKSKPDFQDAKTRPIAGNTLVIVSQKPVLAGASVFDVLQVSRFAMGDPQSSPAGNYARQALQSAGLWQSVRENAVFTENVRVGLQLAARGEVEAAIVYASDLPENSDLKIIHEFADKAHSPIEYTAVITNGDNPMADRFVDFLVSEKGRELDQRFGFFPFTENNSAVKKTGIVSIQEGDGNVCSVIPGAEGNPESSAESSRDLDSGSANASRNDNRDCTQ